MIKVLHTADWHMDAPLWEFTEAQRRRLRGAMLELPGQIADICIREGCDLMLIAGDVFDGSCTRESYEAVYRALERVRVPVFIAPGNHDPYREGSVWDIECWPENVVIFTQQEITSVRVPELSCRIYGAAFGVQGGPCLPQRFRAECAERHALLVVHTEPTAMEAIFDPAAAARIRETGLDYVALGHVHAQGRFGSGGTCSWPGSPMGLSWDEDGEQSVLVVSLDTRPQIHAAAVEGPRFITIDISGTEDPVAAVASALSAAGSRDYFRVLAEGVPEETVFLLQERFGACDNLLIRTGDPQGNHDREPVREDSLEGIFFRILREEQAGKDRQTVRTMEQAASIVWQILHAQEVELP